MSHSTSGLMAVAFSIAFTQRQEAMTNFAGEAESFCFILCIFIAALSVSSFLYFVFLFGWRSKGSRNEKGMCSYTASVYSNSY